MTRDDNAQTRPRSPLGDKLPPQRKVWNDTTVWFLIAFFAANLLAARYDATLERQRQENLLVSAHPGHGKPRYDWSSGAQLAHFLPEIPDARQHPLVIVAGMSQMYAINDKKDGDEIVAEHLDDELSKSNVRAFGLAAPNLHNEEALYLLLATLVRPETRPKVFLYGVCFDKFRNIDLRPEFQKYLTSDPRLLEAWRHVCDGRTERYALACEKMAQSLKSTTEPQGTAHSDDLESRIRNVLSRLLPIVRARSNLNAAISGQFYLLRNFLFNIKPTSKRPIIVSRYELNQQFLELIIEVAKRNGVVPMLYINPLNPQGDNPYVPEQYLNFKMWLQDVAKNQNVAFANLEDAVPAQFWGEFMGGPDFKHFRAEGHRMTANAILKSFGNEIRHAIFGYK